MSPLHPLAEGCGSGEGQLGGAVMGAVEWIQGAVVAGCSADGLAQEGLEKQQEKVDQEKFM